MPPKFPKPTRPGQCKGGACPSLLGYSGLCSGHFQVANQKERSPDSRPGFVWFRVPKLAPVLRANLGGGLGLHCLVGICEAYYGDLSWGVRCGTPQHFAKQLAMTVRKRLQFT